MADPSTDTKGVPDDGVNINADEDQMVSNEMLVDRQECNCFGGNTRDTGAIRWPENTKDIGPACQEVHNIHSDVLWKKTAPARCRALHSTAVHHRQRSAGKVSRTKGV